MISPFFSTNVSLPASLPFLQVADALIEAGKTFNLLFTPGRGHTSDGEYGNVRRFDFFVEHLLDVEPPNWNDNETAANVPLPWDESSPSDDG